MLTIETHLRLDDSIPASPNLTPRFPQEDLDRIGSWVCAGYDSDERSRTSWMSRTQAAMDLALQLQKAKSFPWDDCSNIAFPLITIAALQFHARAYPALISGTSIVKFRTPGPDTKGEAYVRACRVGDYMSYQVLEEDQPWEEQHDRLLIQLPIVGCAFIKTQYDAGQQHNISELVGATSLAMDYYAKSVESCARKTQLVPFYRNEVHERCISGVWRDITAEPWYLSPTAPASLPDSHDKDKRTGLRPSSPDEATPLLFLEQHCLADFDKDGYAEPYIITVEMNSKQVVRIVARWESKDDVERNGAGRVIRIRATEYFTKYGLIPSPDGSIYDMGFGVLLGPLNESVNSLVNMLMDAGTMSVTSGGFLSRGVKIRGGEYKFSPFQWNRVDSTGDDLHKGIVQLPVREPSNVLFTLLTFLVNYTQRISGSTDAISGENPGQNTPAQTQQSMIEQGQKIYSALFKRVWRCMKNEFGKLYILNARHMPVSKKFGGSGTIAREDFLYDPSQVAPVADPNITSDTMRLQQASAIAQRAREVPGYDVDQAEVRLLEAMKVDGIEVLYTGTKNLQPQPPEKLLIAQANNASKEKISMGQMQSEMYQFVIKMQEEQRLNAAKILEMEANATFLAAQADSEPIGHQIALVDSMIGALKARDESLRGHIDLMLKRLEMSTETGAVPLDTGSDTSGLGGLAPQPNDQGGNALPGPSAG